MIRVIEIAVVGCVCWGAIAGGGDDDVAGVLDDAIGEVGVPFTVDAKACLMIPDKDSSFFNIRFVRMMASCCNSSSSSSPADSSLIGDLGFGMTALGLFDDANELETDADEPIESG